MLLVGNVRVFRSSDSEGLARNVQVRIMCDVVGNLQVMDFPCTCCSCPLDHKHQGVWRCTRSSLYANCSASTTSLLALASFCLVITRTVHGTAADYCSCSIILRSSSVTFMLQLSMAQPIKSSALYLSYPLHMFLQPL